MLSHVWRRQERSSDFYSSPTSIKHFWMEQYDEYEQMLGSWEKYDCLMFGCILSLKPPVTVSHWPFCCPYQWWGYLWSWNDWGRSLPSSHSCPHASCRRSQRRRTKKYVCSIDTSWHSMKVKTGMDCSKGFCLKPHLSCLRLSTFDTKRTSPSPFGLP